MPTRHPPFQQQLTRYLCIVVIIFGFMTLQVHAQTPNPTPSSNTNQTQTQPQTTQPALTLEPQFYYPQETTNPNASKINFMGQLPQGSWSTILAGIIKILLGITGSLATLSFTVGGIMLVTARGNDDGITKAKNIIVWSIIALVIIATSYALVLGLTQLKFF